MNAAIGEIFRRYAPGYLQRFGQRLLPSHRKALRDLSRCRTEALGGHLCQCPECRSDHYRCPSCSTRSCPTSQWKNAEVWIEVRRCELLPVTYFHLVFTLPRQLREIIRANQTSMLAVLFQAAVSS